MKGEKASKNAKAIIKDVSTFIMSLFTHFKDDEKQSLRQCFTTDIVFCFWLVFSGSNKENYSSNFVLSNRGWNIDQLD